MQIINSTLADTDTIFALYDAAIEFQKRVSPQQWQGFERSLIETEIRENRQFKILVNGEVACIFAITFSDALIWGERDRNDAIYIHRIVTNPTFRGQGFVSAIVTWAKTYAAQHGKSYVRMDTWADNQKLLQYYTGCGFTYMGVATVQNTTDLPAHYADIKLSLFELAV